MRGSAGRRRPHAAPPMDHLPPLVEPHPLAGVLAHPSLDHVVEKLGGRIDVDPARITFTFLANQKVPKQQCDEQRRMLEEIAEKVAGRKIPVTVTVASGAPAAVPAKAAAATGSGSEAPRASEEDLRQQAMADPTVQALFEIFPVEKSKIEEI